MTRPRRPVMFQLRFSLAELLSSFLLCALLLGSLTAWRVDATPREITYAGLYGCSFLFGLFGRMMGQTALRGTVLTALFYGWGWACLTVTETALINGPLRLAMASIAVAFSGWTWFSSQPFSE